MPSVPPIRGSFRTDARARAAYSEGAGVYRVLPVAVALPVDETDLRTLLEWSVGSGQSADSRQSLVLRGAGSAMGGGNVGDGVLVDLTAMSDRRLTVDAAARTAVASAGVTLGQVEQAAAAAGLRLPPDPSSARWATVGGVFSTNASGPRTLRYGSVRRWALGATIITAEGERLLLRRGEAATDTAATRRFDAEVAPRLRASAATIRERFPRTRKNSSGYALDAWLESGDLLDLFIGAEGTLGVVTEVTWRLDPIPQFRSALQVEIPTIDRIAEVITALVATGPSVCELLDRTFLEVVRSGAGGTNVVVPDADAVLLLEYEEDSAAALEAAVMLGERAAVATGARAVRPRTASDEAAIWALRHAASPILARLPLTQRSMQVVEDGCVPVKCLAEYLQLLRDATSRRDLPIVLFGHAGDGHVHANLLPDTTRPGWTDAVTSLLAEVSAGVVALGGTPAGEHGDGRLRAGLMDLVYGGEITGLFQLVKNCFDPLGILNPGVILPAVPEESPLSRLKVGADAAPIPDDIALALRTIEREGGYGRPRLEVADAPHDSRLTTDSPMNILRDATVTLLARPQFVEPAHLPIQWQGSSTDGERLAEFAGRLCYMSQHNPAGRSTAEYLENILKQGHGSVFEHSTYVLLLEGISRSCTHELVRHRAGFGYSQLSQRYVDESEANFVMPPAIQGDAALEGEWQRAMEWAQTSYVATVELLMEKYSWVESRVHRRKMAREAARSVLPNGTETKIVVSANVRAWRTMLELRLGEGAELEIRRLAVMILRVLKVEAPALFGDFEIYRAADGTECGRVGYHKV